MGQRRQIFGLRESYCLLVRRWVCPEADSNGEEPYRWQVSPKTLALVLLEPLWRLGSSLVYPRPRSVRVEEAGYFGAFV